MHTHLLSSTDYQVFFPQRWQMIALPVQHTHTPYTGRFQISRCRVFKSLGNRLFQRSLQAKTTIKEGEAVSHTLSFTLLNGYCENKQ